MQTSTSRPPTVSSSSSKLGLVLITLAGLSFVPAVVAKTHLKISAPGSAVDAFENWTSGMPWEKITSFKNANASRPVVDLVLQLQALKAGGLDFDFEFVRALTYDLAKKQLVEGNVDLTAETIWDNEIDTSLLLKSDTVIRQGEFVKGVYMLPSNQTLLKISSLDELRGFTGVVVATWALDVKTMEDIKLKGLVKSPTSEIVFSNIQKQLADFALWEFSASPDMGVVIAGIKLVPVPNCKVAIMGSRSWVVSKASPNANAVYAALNAGTKILRENGTIERAFKESGFFNPRVADWKRLF